MGLPSDTANEDFSEAASDQDSEINLLGSLPYRLSTDAFYSATDEQERDLLRFEVNCALQHFLEFDRPIYLEGLGLVVPSRIERTRAYPSGQSLVVRRETVRKVTFEKCDDVSAAEDLAIVSDRSVVDTRELAERIYPRLPLGLHLKWSMQAMRSLLRAYLFSIRDRLVTKGVSQFLSAVGTLYALHNRQGNTPSDWYAGADILLMPRRSQVLQVLDSRLCARPVLQSAWEPLQALYGPPVRTLCLDLMGVLKETGFAVDDSTEQANDTKDRLSKRQIEVAVFLDNESKPQKPRLIWCTEGVRDLARSVSADVVATELVVQTPADENTLNGVVEDNLPIASRLLALGWAVLLSTRNKTLRPGLGINAESPLITQPKSLLTAAVATHVQSLSGVHLDEFGEFSYANLTGISYREARLISAGKRIHLLSMLELRGLDQITQSGRGCLLEHTKIDH